MEVLSDGSFEFDLSLKRGLRPSKRSPRDEDFLITCVGAVGYDRVLQVLEDLSANRIATNFTAAFPYPQLFVFTDTVVICTDTDVYEYALGALSVSKITVTAHDLWTAVDFHRFIYMSNGLVAVERNPSNYVWSLSTRAISSGHTASDAMCNYNGQVLVAEAYL